MVREDDVEANATLLYDQYGASDEHECRWSGCHHPSLNGMEICAYHFYGDPPKRLDWAEFLEALATPNEAANRDSWKSEPMPGSRERLQFKKKYHASDAALIMHGLIPKNMDDKWFIYFEDDWLHICRSWTGHCIFLVRFAWSSNELTVQDAWVNREPSQYTWQDSDADIALLEDLIMNKLLLRSEGY